MFLKVTEYCPTRIQSNCRAVKNVKDSFGYEQRAVSSNFTMPDPRSKIQQSVLTGSVLHTRGLTAFCVTLLHVSVLDNDREFSSRKWQDVAAEDDLLQATFSTSSRYEI